MDRIVVEGSLDDLTRICVVCAYRETLPVELNATMPGNRDVAARGSVAAAESIRVVAPPPKAGESD